MTDRSTPAAPLRRVHWLVRLLPLGAALVFLLGLALARPELAAGSAVARPQAGSHAQVRSTPRQTVRGYLEAARTSEWARAAEFLDLSGARLATGSEEAASLAHDLKIVLDRTAWIELALVSDSPEGARDDGLDPELERIARVPTPQGEVPILLARQTTAAGVEWRFAPDTVAAIPELYAVHGHGWVEELLPAPFFEVRVLEVELWQWLGLLLAGLLGSALAYLGTWGLARVLHHVVQRTKSSWDDELLARAASPIRFALSVLGFYLIAQFLALNAPAAAFLALACKALTVVAATWLILSMIDVLAEAVHRGLERRDVNAANTLVPIGRRATKIFVLGIALVSLIHNLGFNVAGILAGLGVGGLAVALAAQKTLENLFGGITIIADRPVEVGQVCRVGEHFGTVEEIGMRSTRLRTLDRTLVTIANAEFAGARIDNFSRRDKMRLYTVLQVGYDTTPDQMRYLLVELRRLLYAHPKVSHDPCRVRFVALNTYSLDIEVFAFVETQDWNEFLGIREDLYLRFLDVVKKSGAYFAYPSQTLYLGRDGGRDLARSAEAERAVRAWQEAGTLPLPEFPPEAIAALDDTLEFPPPGSAQHRPMA